MSKIVLDSSLRSKLNGLQETLEICEENGQVQGYFLPAELFRQYFYAWLKSQVSDQELAELRNQTGGKPLDEIWKNLGRT
jgi:myo-inositol catabolism protein IolC